MGSCLSSTAPNQQQQPTRKRDGKTGKPEKIPSVEDLKKARKQSRGVSTPAFQHSTSKKAMMEFSKSYLGTRRDETTHEEFVPEL